MNRWDSPFQWSFSIGTWFATRVRVSVFTPLIALILMYRLPTPQEGLIVAAILFVSLLLHEFAHILSARATQGYGEEIVIFPLGGVAYVQTGRSFLSRFLVPASGPILNFAICAGLMPMLWSAGLLGEYMNPMNYGGDLTPAHGVLEQFMFYGFAVNWMLFLINLIPVHPLDGGRMLQAVLTEQYGSQVSTEIYLRVGAIAGIIFVVCGLMFSSATLAAIGAFVWVMNVQETYRMRSSEAYDDSFMGYDFSQGYTSLEREETPQAKQPGVIARWREKRKVEREEREQERAVEDEKQLDDILARLHETGFDSLSDAEKRVLKRASNRFRNRDSS